MDFYVTSNVITIEAKSFFKDKKKTYIYMGLQYVIYPGNFIDLDNFIFNNIICLLKQIFHMFYLYIIHIALIHIA